MREYLQVFTMDQNKKTIDEGNRPMKVKMGVKMLKYVKGISMYLQLFDLQLLTVCLLKMSGNCHPNK